MASVEGITSGVTDSLQSTFNYLRGGKKDGNNGIVGGFLACICFGPLLVIMGIVSIIASFNNIREENISKFEASLSAWSDNSNIYTNQVISIGEPWTETITTTGFEEDDINERLKDDKLASSFSSGTFTYTSTSSPNFIPIEYEALSKTLSGVDFFGAPSTWTQSDFTLKMRAVNSTIPESSIDIPIMATLELNSIQIFCNESAEAPSYEQCATKCPDENQGYWDSSRALCIVYESLSSACFKYDSDGAFSTEGGGPGCGFEAEGGFEGTVFTRVTAPLDGSTPTPPSFSSVSYTLRSIDDPFVALALLSNGSLDLGPTAQEQLSWGIGMVVVGALICIGLISIVCCLSKSLMSCCSSSKHEEKVKERQQSNTVRKGQREMVAPIVGKPKSGPARASNNQRYYGSGTNSHVPQAPGPKYYGARNNFAPAPYPPPPQQQYQQQYQGGWQPQPPQQQHQYYQQQPQYYSPHPPPPQQQYQQQYQGGWQQHPPQQQGGFVPAPPPFSPPGSSPPGAYQNTSGYQPSAPQ